MKRRIFWAWYDMWIGFYWDRKNRVLYFCPLPTIVIVLYSGGRYDDERGHSKKDS